MKIYLVGGAVRDQLLGLTVKDRDWVVVNSTPEEMLARGFRPVGQDFPVFLHPKTREEYALARTERKSGHGYTGFTFHTDPEVTLEQDLIRRDLTINAIARDESGEIIDPYHGQQDLEQRVLRHVSPAFQEDPLRVLRVARFAARFADLGFTIADDTMALMAHMVGTGETDYLVAERVWQETSRALMENRPEIYFLTLMGCGALNSVAPEWLPFLTRSPVCLSALQQAASISASDAVRFACLFARNSHTSLDELKSFVRRMRFPAQHAELAMLVYEHADTAIETIHHLTPESLMSLFEAADALRRPERFSEFLTATSCIAHASSRTLPASQQQAILKMLQDSLDINAKSLDQQGIKGREIGEKLRLMRIDCLRHALSGENSPE